MSADLMSFTAFTFEDRITACASHNQRVRGNQGPDCFLKGMQSLRPSSRPGLSSNAVLISVSRSEACQVSFSAQPSSKELSAVLHVWLLDL